MGNNSRPQYIIFLYMRSHKLTLARTTSEFLAEHNAVFSAWVIPTGYLLFANSPGANTLLQRMLCSYGSKITKSK